MKRGRFEEEFDEDSNNISSKKSSNQLPQTLRLGLDAYEASYRTLHVQDFKGSSEKLIGLVALLRDHSNQLESLCEDTSEIARSIRSLEISQDAQITKRVQLVQEAVNRIQEFSTSTLQKQNDVAGLMGDSTTAVLEARLETKLLELNEKQEVVVDACLELAINGWPR